MAQLDSASVFGTEGYRFESCRAYFSFLSSTSLIQGLKNQDRAWQRLVDLHASLVFAWCRRVGLQSEDCADVEDSLRLLPTCFAAGYEPSPGTRSAITSVVEMRNRWDGAGRQPISVFSTSLRLSRPPPGC